jgi:molybdopterin molybdotransferase
MLPDGADAVVLVEYIEKAGDNIAIYDSVAAGMGMAEADEDLAKGQLLLGKGTIIRPQETAALAAAGITEIPAFVPLSIAIISTGDELVRPEQQPAPGEIRDINTYSLKALAAKHGYHVTKTQTLPDVKPLLERSVKEAMNDNDIVIISGGSSQGEEDYTAQVFNAAAKPGVFTHGLAVKPGKPTILGWDETNKTILAGLPGHPVSAMMVFEILFGWLHNKLFQTPPTFPIPARISSNVPGSPGRTVLLPVILRLEENGYTAEPVFGKSGMIVTLTRANGYIIIDMNKEGLKKDEDVLVHLF